MASIDAFAANYSSQWSHVDILVNNGAVFIPPHSITAEGFEVTLGVNFIGNVYITSRLLPLLKKSADARIVVLGAGPMTAPVALYDRVVGTGDLGGEHLLAADTSLEMVTLSKLLLTIYAAELQLRLRNNDVQNVFLASAFPGAVATQGLEQSNSDLFIVRLLRVVAPWFASSVEEGVLSSLFLATGPLSEVNKFRGLICGPGPALVAMTNKRYTAENCKHVFDAVDELIQKKGYQKHEF